MATVTNTSVTIDNLTYDLYEDNTAIIKSCIESISGEFTIPSTIEYGEEGEEKKEYSVISIGVRAFWYCENITDIKIPDSIKSIDFEAFLDCTGLESMTIPFIGATKDGTTNTHFGYIFGASSHGYHKTRVPESLKTVVITNGATSVSTNAFTWCSNIENIIFPDSVTSIGDFAFA